MADRPIDVRGDELELVLGGRSFTGWKRMTVARALSSLSAEFELVVVDRAPYPVRPGDAVTVKVAGELVLSGFVDRIKLEGGEEGRTFEIAGRDRTADLIDCSAGLPQEEGAEELSEIAGGTLLELVELLAAPLGVTVRAAAGLDATPFDLFRRQPGETAWSAVERLCRRRGVLAFSSPAGELLLELPAAGVAAGQLLEGPRGNVISWAVSVDHRERFSLYDVRAQVPGTDDYAGLPALEIGGRATDEGIQRFRPLLVLGEGAMTFEDTEDRAAWEAAVRAARSERLEVIVPGWRQVPKGRVWAVNETVQVDIPRAGLRSTLLVDEVTFVRDEGGSTTRLGLTRPTAYQAEPVVEDLEDFLGEGDEAQ